MCAFPVVARLEGYGLINLNGQRTCNLKEIAQGHKCSVSFEAHLRLIRGVAD